MNKFPSNFHLDPPSDGTLTDLQQLALWLAVLSHSCFPPSQQPLHVAPTLHPQNVLLSFVSCKLGSASCRIHSPSSMMY